MKVIAKKKKGLIWFYACSVIIGLMSFILALSTDNFDAIYVLIGLFLLVFGLVLSIQYFNLPRELISVDESTGQIYLHPEDVTVSPWSIVDISYRKGRLRYAYFRWGILVITTPNEVYEYHSVDHCEQVAKDLLKIVYSHRNK